MGGTSLSGPGCGTRTGRLTYCRSASELPFRKRFFKLFLALSRPRLPLPDEDPPLGWDVLIPEEDDITRSFSGDFWRREDELELRVVARPGWVVARGD